MEIISISIIIVTFFVSYKGFKERSFFDQYSFRVDEILVHKEYQRIVTSGFLHVDWKHFIFNMLSLYLFSTGFERRIGSGMFATIYFGSLIGGSLLSLFLHRNHGRYSAVGASGAVMGIIFASIAFFPGMTISPLLLPIPIPGWIAGLLYTLYTIYGIKAQNDNIGHDAHLGGGIVGLLIIVLTTPKLFITNTLAIAAILIPALAFIYIIIKRPEMLMVSNPFKKPSNKLTIEHQYNVNKTSKQKEIDAILDKINRVGLDKISQKERDRLEELTK